MQEAWTAPESIGEFILVVESDGLNVEPVIVAYSLNGTGTAQGCSSYRYRAIIE